ncbi:putative tNRA methyltransferase [Clostridium neonatale]|uniref:tRNA (adenine(22)-N(1))-methyltransferase n=1 Tax=Clostridium neonatale TaxID=137838 RepID=UPI00291C1D4D|nr:class I SAM-dependent methyltransferase [Clostridium neonatale]CAI3676567.1 putative tNRA methyltransferase [Clostridium neonatale]
MELSKRLNWILEKVDKCETIIDVGTDHGYIPIKLIKDNIASRVIASDINKEPLEKARINASLDGVIEKVDLRLGGGLKTLKRKEVQGIIIAGMGGNLIRDILEADLDKVKDVDYLVLQPAQNPEVLREYLYTHEYEIIDEDICLDEGKYYELFKVKYKKNNITKLEDVFYEISPVMLKKRTETLKSYIEDKVEKNNKILNFINDDTEHAKERKKQLIRKNEILEKFLEDF